MATLKQFRAAPATQHLKSFASRPLKEVVAAKNLYDKGIIAKGLPKKMQPEQSAIRFYLRNHAVAVLHREYDVCEPLSPEHLEIVEDYHEVLRVDSARMFFYLLMICTRESRHANSGTQSVLNSYANIPSDWYNAYHGGGQSSALTALFDKTPNVTVGEYASFLTDIFFKCKYSSGFGGKAWGGIAEVLRQFVHGETTAEMMLDTAFTLCHNNGPIFNKGMLYTHYDASIKEILDVQRGGMIPQYVTSTTKYAGNHHASAADKLLVAKMASVSSEFCGEVDWKRIKELGALGNYTQYIPKTPPKPKTKAELLAEKLHAEKLAKLEASKWQIMPGQFAYISEREKTATESPAAVEEI